MIIYRPNDRIPLKIGKITLIVSPLTGDQNSELATYTKMQGGKEVVDVGRMAISTLKFAVKDIQGVDATYIDGTKFELERDGDYLTEQSVGDLYEIFGTAQLNMIAAKLISKQIDEIPGVKIEIDKVVVPKKTRKRRSRYLSAI